MAITLEGIALPADIQWVDEFTSHGVAQTVTTTLTGALVVEESVLLAGKPITLQSNGAALIDQATLEQLQNLAKLPLAGTTLTLDWNGDITQVVFDHNKGAIEATEVMRLADSAQPADHPYFVTIRLLTA